MYNCHIIGFPLNNPRSVSIWKKYFKKNKIKSTMSPIEVKPNKLADFINKIKKNNKFLVTTPLKINAFNYIIPGDNIAHSAKSINLIIKNKNLYGFNTDISSLIKIISKYKKKNILIIGLGGVGLPLSRVLSEIKNYKISAITRRKNNKIKNVKLYRSFNEIKNFKFDLIINCTPLGSDLKKKYLDKSPISEKIMKKIYKNNFNVLDIIYKPKKNKLFQICKKFKIDYENGLRMNTLQASIALKLISSSLVKNV